MSDIDPQSSDHVFSVYWGDEDHEPDLRGPAIIVEGSVLSGFKFIGPFETIRKAMDWHVENTRLDLIGENMCIALLESPVKYWGLMTNE